MECHGWFELECALVTHVNIQYGFCLFIMFLSALPQGFLNSIVFNTAMSPMVLHDRARYSITLSYGILCLSLWVSIIMICVLRYILFLVCMFHMFSGHVSHVFHIFPVSEQLYLLMGRTLVYIMEFFCDTFAYICTVSVLPREYQESIVLGCACQV